MSFDLKNAGPRTDKTPNDEKIAILFKEMAYTDRQGLATIAGILEDVVKAHKTPNRGRTAPEARGPPPGADRPGSEGRGPGTGRAARTQRRPRAP